MLLGVFCGIQYQGGRNQIVNPKKKMPNTQSQKVGINYLSIYYKMMKIPLQIIINQ